ncbi:MAG: cysteine desulfurase family protein [Clostridia bacterium]|nr:cysteine desulfurase family protein [Clostridia bacterium]
MNKEVYLDNAATTKICKNAQKDIIEEISKLNANPSAVYEKGLLSQEKIEQAKEIIATFINAKPKEIYFSPGGTYSNNMAIMGAVKALRRRGNKIITAKIEHASVLNVMKALEKEGFEIVYLPVDKSGKISLPHLSEELNNQTILVSIMYINNEIGAIQPIKEIASLIRRKAPNAIFHTDAVSAFGKIKIDVKNLDVDLMSASSHKVYGPSGVGLLYVKEKVRIEPIVFGGGQGLGLTPGTEPVFLISAFSKAVKNSDIDKKSEYVRNLKKYAVEQLLSIDNIVINSSDDSSDYIINCSVGNIKSETLLNFLSSRNIYISAGSACSKGKQSHVLKAINLSPELIDSAIRISFAYYNDYEDIDILIENLKQALNRLAVARRFRKK